MPSLRFCCFAMAFIALVKHCSAWSPPQRSFGGSKTLADEASPARRRFFEQTAAVVAFSLFQGNQPSFADDDVVLEPPSASLSGDAKKLFNDGRVFEYIYGWSQLGNTQVALGDLTIADESYSNAISLCRENLARTEKGFGIRRCDDLSILLLNRGSVRLNNGRQEDALSDLESASVLRGQPDAVILQNLARARELNGYYKQSDRDYTLAISMTANEVNPFWLRSALVKLQLGGAENLQSGFDLLKRVDNRFPEAPEVRAAYATFLAARGDEVAARQKYLEIPDRQREKFSQNNYLTQVISWPPAAIDVLLQLMAGAEGKERKVN